MSEGLTTQFLREAMAERGYAVSGDGDVEIVDGFADSREVTPGSLWVAFRGERHDGNDYIDDALARGAAAVVCEREPQGTWERRTVVVAPDARKAAGELARAWLDECGTKVAGITGTVGKTTTKELTASLLGTRFRTHRSKANFNSLEGLPLALTTLQRDDEISVLELAMDRPGEIVALCKMVRPSVGAVLNIGLTHASRLGSIEAIAREKLSLARWLPREATAVLNLDDPRIAPVVPELQCQVITFGSGEGATLRADAVEPRGLEGTAFTLQAGGERFKAFSPLPGAHTLQAAMAALGVALACGMEPREALEALARTNYRGRMVRREGREGSVIIDDRYNSSPASLSGALEMLGTLKGRRIALLGTMAELGDAEREEHCRAGTIAARTCDVVAATGEPCRTLVEAAKRGGLEQARWFADREAAASWVRDMLQPGDYVLVKASRSQAFEEILPLLEAAP